jgi:Bacteriophage head to tail connecting protein
MRVGDSLFSNRMPLMTLWQTEAENFHVMRADFTRARYPNEEFASYLMSGRPAMAARELENAIRGTLRPHDRQWFHARTLDDRINEDIANRRYLDFLSTRQRLLTYDRRANFTRATEELDGDWCIFGNGAMTVEPRRELDGLIYRTWHLRDVAWIENSYQEINQVHRNWKPQAFELTALWPKTVAPQITLLENEQKLRQISCRHVILRAEDYDLPLTETRGRPWVSVYIDMENQTILEEKAIKRRMYVIPRWKFTSNSLIGAPYAYSPPAVYGLPDARMFQQMTLTLLEAAQKSVDPPMIAVGEAINGGTNLYAGGITWTDADYDERTGEVLRPMSLEFRGLEFGAAREERLEKILQDVFYNNALAFPTITKEMTATESQRLYEEFVRKALPLIEPIASEYNGQVCEMTFDTLLDMGAFGSPHDIPPALRGQEIRYTFDTPLQEATEKAKVQQFRDVTEITVQGAQIDSSLPFNLDADRAYRDALMGAGPADWVLQKDQVAKLKAQHAQMMQAQQQAQQVGQGTDIAARMGKAAEGAGRAAKALREAGVGG